jgi:nitroreductase
MNPTIDLMLEHRSIRKFTKQEISENDMDAIFRAARAAATSSFQQIISVIQVIDKAKRAKLVELTGHQTYVADSASFLVFCVDEYRHKEISPEAKLGFVEQLMTGCIDAGLAAQNALLAAQSLGLGGVFIGGLRNHPNEVVELLELPTNVFPVFGLCLGYADQQPELKPRLPLSMYVHHDQYHPYTPEELKAYDQQVIAYYQLRSSNSKEISWSESVRNKVSKESRPFMLDCLQRQGFAER